MSSSSATAPCSRSPSPATPESSDCLEPVAIQNDSDISLSWLPMRPEPLSHYTVWQNNGNEYLQKTEEPHMLRLDDLIEEHAYDDASSSPFAYTHEKSSDFMEMTLVAPVTEPSTPSFLASNILIASQNGPVALTKPIPPPASRPRKRDLSAVNQRVVFPPKESCFNLPIMVPSIPEGGTKSRVETQIRVVVDLADACSSSGDPLKYDRVGSWKWLKLPLGTATKKRTRKQGKIDPVAEDILHLSATVTCASPPHNRVLSCSNCQAREAKRVARKLAARVRPARSDSDSLDENNQHTKPLQEDTTSIIQFNCAEILDFSTGSVVLPLRLTCYCRHHREKLGFNIHFTMMDHSGRIVGMGTSRPIMITDDHKTTGIHKSGEMNANGFPSTDFDWHSTVTANGSHGLHTSLKRRQSHTKDSSQQTRKRAKPYDSTRNGTSRLTSREASVVSSASPTTTKRSPSPLQCQISDVMSQQTNLGPVHNPDSHLLALNNTVFNNTEKVNTFGLPDVSMPEPSHLDATLALNGTSSPISSELHSSPLPSPSISGVLPHALPFFFFNPSPSMSMSALPSPKIHRLIPACGPTHGGIEVTVLGANFCPSIQLNCVFGDVTASSTQRWSDNTLVCVLPPRAVPGVVVVWFEGIEKDDDDATRSLFTYSDESDRALMELALQVVGLKMTGKIEDAKNVAMRIVGNAGDHPDSQNGMDTSGMMQVAATFSVPIRDIRPLLLSRTNDGEDFESLIVRFLSILDTPFDHPLSTSSAITHQTPSGQTLLHLAAFLGFSTLVAFLIEHNIDLDVRDRNGYTALHFAVLERSKTCAELLVKAGADMEIVNVRGKTAQEEAPSGFFDGMLDGGDSELPADESAGEEDEEAEWGDAEEDGEDRVVYLARRSSGRRSHRRTGSTSKGRSASREESPSTGMTMPGSTADTARESAAAAATTTTAKKPRADDAKQTASFVDMIQRRLAQLPAAQGIIPKNMPLLPKYILHLPGMPAVRPWGALPNIPMVFPVLVPIPGWPSFLGEKRVGGMRKGEVGKGEGEEKKKGEDADGGGEGEGGESETETLGGCAIRAAQEWVMTWEKWMAVAIAAATRQQQQQQQQQRGEDGEDEETPPPVYTPRSECGGGGGVPLMRLPTPTPAPAPAPSGAGSAAERVSMMRRVGYEEVPVPDRAEVNSFGYQHKKSRKLQKKHDRMLLLFWLPILLLSLLWSFHNGIQFVYHAIKNALPVKTFVRS